MPTKLKQSKKNKIINTVEKLQDIFIGDGDTVRSIFNHQHQNPTQNIDHKKACIKFIVCILDTIHDFGSGTTTVIKEWVKWMLEYGGKIGIGTTPISIIDGNPNKLWTDWKASSSSNVSIAETIIQTMVTHPEDVAIYFIFGWGESSQLRPISDIGHEYRFEYYLDKSLTNYEGYKAFYMAHQDKHNNDWICNELVEKQKIFYKNNGTNTEYKYFDGTVPYFEDNGVKTTQGPSLMIDNGCVNYSLNAFTLNLSNQTILRNNLTGSGDLKLPDATGSGVKLPDATGSGDLKLPDATGSGDLKLPDATGSGDVKLPSAKGSGDIELQDPVFGTIPSNFEFNCAIYTGIAKNYDMGQSETISYYCDESTIRHNHKDADATTGSLFFEITDSDQSKLQYINPAMTSVTPVLSIPQTTITLLNNTKGKDGLRNTLNYLLKKYNSSGNSLATFFTLAEDAADTFKLTLNAFTSALLPDLWKPSASKTELWKKLSINYDLKRNGDWNQTIDCLRKDSKCSGSGWDETVFMTHDGIAAAISAVIVGVNTIWVWSASGNRNEYSSVYIPRCNTSIPLPSKSFMPTNTANLSESISTFVDSVDSNYKDFNSSSIPMTGGKPIVLQYINSIPVTKIKLIECLDELCRISIFDNNIIQPLQSNIRDLNIRRLLCSTYVSNYNWDIIINPHNNEEILNFYDRNYDEFERSLINFVKDKRKLGKYLIEQKRKMPKNTRNIRNSTIAQRREMLEIRSNASITNTQNRRATNINLRREMRLPSIKAVVLSGGQNNKTIGNLIKEALINFYDKYKRIDDKDKDRYINNIYTSLLYKLLNYELNGIIVGSDEYMCHIMTLVLEENIISLIKLNIPNINWNKIDELIEVNDDNNLVNEIKKINKKKKKLFLTKVNNEITESFNAMRSVDKNLNFKTYLKNSFDEILNSFKHDISYIIDIILSTKKYKISDEKALQVLEIIDTILQNTKSEEPLKKIKSVIADMKPLQDNGVKEYFPSQLKKKRVNGIVTTANKQVPSLRNSKIRISSKVPLKFNIKVTRQDKLNMPKKPSQMLTRQDKLNTPKKPSQMLTRQDKLNMPKKPSQMLTRQDKSIRDKLKLRIEQFKNKDFSPYFEKKINSHINDMGVNIYNIGINRMKSILKDIYEIKK